MSPPNRKTGPRVSEKARLAALAARAAKRAEPDTFGLPELFVVKAGDHAFTWELRRFGGVVLQRGAEAFPDQSLARADGEAALAELRASPDLPTFTRQTESRTADGQPASETRPATCSHTAGPCWPGER